MTEYYNKIITKPWGYEWRIFINDVAAIWYLHIDEGECTSMHCHLNKKSSFVSLAGITDMEFMSNTVRLQPMSKIVLRQGLFHSIHAVSEAGIDILEIESPPMKNDLLRLADPYGRNNNKQYQGEVTLSPFASDTLYLDKYGTYELAGCTLEYRHINNYSDFESICPEDMVMVLHGGIHTDAGDFVLSPADAVVVNIIDRLYKAFRNISGMDILIISKKE